MSTKQPCICWSCNKSATYEKPLCYSHWLEWEAWELEECTRCHWIYGGDDSVVYDTSGFEEEFPFLCDNCLRITLIEMGRGQPWWGGRNAERRPVLAHALLERPVYYVYILKLSDGKFYIGQTTNLDVRLREHRDGQQSQTKDRDPKLVYFESFVGGREEVKNVEDELTRLNQSGAGRRRLREMIEKFRDPLRLLDLEA